MRGSVEEYLFKRLKSERAVHLTLLDPEKVDTKNASEISRIAQSAGSSGIMIGGSTSISVYHLDDVVKAVKKTVDIPVILFPNDVTGISRYADAVFFMSLLNSSNPYYITGVQALGAPLVKRYGLEAISLGYLIVGEGGGAAGFIGQARPIPYEKPELAGIYALAAQYLGMHLVYLEAGSGAEKPVPAEMIRAVKRMVEIPVIVGGGIRSPKAAVSAVKAGADIIVTGTLIERSSREIGKVIQSIKKAK